MAARPEAADATDYGAALASYTELFGQLLTIGIAGGAVLLLISPLLKKMMHGVH